CTDMHHRQFAGDVRKLELIDADLGAARSRAGKVPIVERGHERRAADGIARAQGSFGQCRSTLCTADGMKADARIALTQDRGAVEHLTYARELLAREPQLALEPNEQVLTLLDRKASCRER